MKVLLLCAGIGNRLKPLSNYLPKILMPIHGRALLDWWFDIFEDEKEIEFLINTHYLPEKMDYYLSCKRKSYNIQVTYEKELLGTAGTILKNKQFFDSRPFIVAHADNLTDFDYKKFVSYGYDKNSLFTMMTFETDRPKSCGIVKLSENGFIKEFHEKVANPPGNLANAAVYIFKKNVISFLESKKSDVIDISTEVIPFFINKINTFNNTNFHLDIGSPEAFLKAQKEWNKKSKKSLDYSWEKLIDKKIFNSELLQLYPQQKDIIDLVWSGN